MGVSCFGEWVCLVWVTLLDSFGIVMLVFVRDSAVRFCVAFTSVINLDGNICKRVCF